MLHEVPYDHYRFTFYSLQEHFKNTAFLSSEIYPLGGYNASLIIMMSLWNRFSGDNRWSRLVVRFFLKLFYKSLLKRDQKYGAADNKSFGFDNCAYPSGLWGYGTK